MFSTIIIAIFLLIPAILTQQCSYPNQRCICMSSPLCRCASITSASTFNFSTSYKSHLVLQAGLGCLPCSASCLQCTSTTVCTSCQNQFVLINNTCVGCPINCQNCRLITSYASNLLNLQCLSCLQGYYLDQNSQCQLCALVGSSQCTSETIISCVPSYWLDNNGATCVNCDPNCVQCSSTTKCSICKNGYYMNSFKCLKCMSQCLTCANSTSCTTCVDTNLYFDASNGLCASCGFGCLSCTNGSICLVCGSNQNNTQYTLTSAGLCIVTETSLMLPHCSQNKVLNQTLTCSVCQNDYFQQVGSTFCHYGCSILCNTCQGAHYGLCSSCQPNTFLYNRHCIPKNNINNGAAYQRYITASHNLNNNTFINFPTLTLITRLMNQCLKQSIISSKQIQLNLNHFQAYQIALTWKVYLLSTNTTDYSYQVTFNNSNNLVIADFVCQHMIQVTGCNYICISKANFTISDKIMQYNTLKFSSLDNGLTFGFAQLLIASFRCGGISGSQCLQCTSINACTKCINPLFYILHQTCVQACPPTYYVYQSQRKCYEICPLGTFNSQQNDGNKICQSCPSQCLTCTSSSICYSCSNGFYLNQQSQKCLSTCPGRYFPNSYLKTCQSCQFPCRQCQSSQQCISCIYGFYDNKTLTCTIACSPGYYGNLYTRSCEPCESPCLTCQLSSKTCLICLSYFIYLNGECYSQCPLGYYLNTSNTQLQCISCDSSCLKCNSSSFCLICSSGYYLNGRCLSSCPIYYYSNELSHKCEQCQQDCILCTNKTYCSLCLPPSILDQTNFICRSYCPKIHYSQQLFYSFLALANSSNFYVCRPCMFPCYECINVSFCISCFSSFLLDNGCVQTCIDGTYPNVENLTCIKCPQNCSLCQSKFTCTSCLQNYTLFQNNCLLQCPNFYYYDINTQSCLQCAYDCIKCYNSTFCYKCINSLLASSQGQCVDTCPTGFRLNLTIEMGCVKCSNNCSHCITNQNINQQYCILCQIPYYLTLFSTCQLECRLTQFGLGGVCFQCIKPCRTCASQYQCKSCLKGYGYVFLGDCVAECPLGYYQTVNLKLGNFCQKCNNNCISCKNNWATANFICYQCNQSYYLSKRTGTCLNFTQCSDFKYQNFSYFASQFSKHCLRCSPICLTCLGTALNCTSCSSPLLYFNNQCLINCPKGYYNNNQSCKICDSGQQIKCINCRNQNICLQCSNQYYLYTKNKNFSTCLSKCPNGFYGRNSQCYKCSYPCLTCMSAKICTQCDIGYIILTTNNQAICLNNCPSGYYYSEINKTCNPCPKNCAQCINQNNCISCNLNFFLVNGTCKSTCPISYFPSFGVCLPCMYGCVNCIDAYTCNQCIKGFLYQGQCIQVCPYGLIQHRNNLNNTCIRCNNNCLTCRVSPNICTSCTAPLFLHLQRCVSNCLPGSYSEYQLRQCVTCTSPCQTCSNSNSCETCIYGYILYAQQSRNQCVKGPICPNGYFLDIANNFCKISCNSSLFQYTELIDRTCSTQCPQGFVAYQNNLTCLHDCPFSDMWIDSNHKCIKGKQKLANQFVAQNLPYMSCNISNYKSLLQILCYFSLPIANLQQIKIDNIIVQRMKVLYFVVLNNLQGLHIFVQPNLSLNKLKSQLIKVSLRPRYQFYTTFENKQVSSSSRLKAGEPQISKSYPLQNSDAKIYLPFFNFYTQQQRQTGLYLNQLANGISIAAIIIWFFAFIKNKKSITLVWINGLQWLYLLSIVSDSHYPPNVLNFLSGFRTSCLIFASQNNQELFLNDNDRIWASTSKMRNQLLTPIQIADYKTLSIPILGFLIVFILLFLILFCLMLIFRKLNQQQCRNKNISQSLQKSQNNQNKDSKNQQKISQNYSQKDNQCRKNTFTDLSKKLSILVERFKSNYLHHIFLFITIPLSCLFFTQLISPQIGGLTIGGSLTILVIVSWIYFIRQLNNNKFQLFKNQGFQYYIIFSMEGYLIGFLCIVGSSTLFMGTSSIIFLLNIYIYFAIFRIVQWKLKFWCSLQILKILIIVSLVVCSMTAQNFDRDILFNIGWGPVILIVLYIIMLAICTARDLFEQQSMAFNQIIEQQKQNKKSKKNLKPLLEASGQDEDADLKQQRNTKQKIISEYTSQMNVKYQSQESFFEDQQEITHTDSQKESQIFQEQSQVEIIQKRKSGAPQTLLKQAKLLKIQ